MTTWTSADLAEIDAADEITIRSLRSDGTLTGGRTIWIARDGDELYIRSVNGPDAVWFRGTRARREGRLQAGDTERDVTFVDIDQDGDQAAVDALNDRVDAAYTTKYHRYEANIVASINSPVARSTTMRLVSR